MAGLVRVFAPQCEFLIKATWNLAGSVKSSVTTLGGCRTAGSSSNHQGGNGLEGLSIGSSADMPPIPLNGGISAADVFKLAAEKTICAVFGANDVQQSKVVPSIEALTEKDNIGVVSVTDANQANRILEITGRKSLPLFFVKGDCVGGLEDFNAIKESGRLASWLEPHEYDLVVIGGGSGGLAAAKEAARLGKKVACLDFVKPSPQGSTWGLGGTCVNVGCIPKKLMHQAALLGEAIKDAKRFGWNIPEGQVTHSWNRMRDGIQDYIASLNWGYRVQLREKSVTYINSYGTFTGHHEISAKNKKGKVQKITADRFLVATGLRPRFPEVEGAREYCITSDDLFALPYNPGKTLCIGASYVSLECAGFLHGIGLDVTVMVRSILLRGFDQDIAEKIRKHMIEKGIRFESGVPVKFEQIAAPTDSKPGRVKVTSERTLENGEKERFFEEYDTVLIAIGRDAVTDDCGFDLAGVKRSKSGKIIGRHEQSETNPYVYAIGDVLDGCPELTPVAIQAGRLTPVAIQAGRVLMRRLFTGNMEMTEYDKIPTTVFTPLEYGCCGISEEDAIKRFGKENLNIYHNVFVPLEFAVPERMDTAHCYCKLICLKTEDDRVLGYHILSPNSGEITQGFAIALKLGGKKSDFDRLIGIHPTVAENLTTLTLLKTDDSGELKASGC
uniref:thioredoxin-disulfide reductase (NADPH) n=1 Tax=Steinernema glaseri TaxID=37863 RepID=A0A1I8AC64_9BILA